MKSDGYRFGMVGLGTMGRNLVMNIANHDFAVAGYDKDVSKVNTLNTQSGERKIYAAATMPDFISILQRPRAVMMLVPAGNPVDAVIADLLPHLSKGDIIIDGGNSHYLDTDRRARELANKGLAFLGVGISGGESGARHGPSIMPGGPQEAYESVRPVFEAAAAKVGNDPCVTYLGPGSAGHYVKMVHNGIEYGVMQLISECYDIMKRGMGLSPNELHEIFDQWNKTELNGYLMEITANIFLKKDDKTGKPLVDQILPQAKQKGTGMWASQDAMTLQVPLPTIDVAVAMRNLSSLADERQQASKSLSETSHLFDGQHGKLILELRNALYASMVVTYAQGMAQLAAASKDYGYGLNLEAVARIWRGGCIIRAALLEDIRSAYNADPNLPNLLLNPGFGRAVAERQEDLHAVVCTAANLGIPAPALMASLAYFDGYRSSWLPANLIQAQRDYFGAHTYQRIDMDGTFHTQWEPLTGETT